MIVLLAYVPNSTEWNQVNDSALGARLFSVLTSRKSLTLKIPPEKKIFFIFQKFAVKPKHQYFLFAIVYRMPKTLAFSIHAFVLNADVLGDNFILVRVATCFLFIHLSRNYFQNSVIFHKNLGLRLG